MIASFLYRCKQFVNVNENLFQNVSFKQLKQHTSKIHMTAESNKCIDYINDSLNQIIHKNPTHFKKFMSSFVSSNRPVIQFFESYYLYSDIRHVNHSNKVCKLLCL